MPAFPEPRFAYDYDVGAQLNALREYPKQAGKKRRTAIEESRERMVSALKAQTMITENGAVILPVAIYK